jgi:hypothetical protein
VALVTAAALLKPGPLDGFDGYFINPVGLEGPLGDVVTTVATAGTAVIVVPLAVSIASLILRLRRSTGPERQQLKWLLLPAVLIVAGAVAAAITEQEHAWTVMLLGLAGVPIAAGVAILRYRLYDIDVVIRRTIVYGVVVAVLAAVYVALVLVLQTSLTQVTGNDTIPVALSTLAIAALFGPLRARVRRIVDRRFYRSRYDAQRTVEAFAARLRDEVELDAVARDLVLVADRAVAPRGAWVWLRRAPDRSP